MSDADGPIKVVEVATRPLTQDLLDHNVQDNKRLQFQASKLQSFNRVFCAGLLPPGSGRDADLCLEREEGEQSGTAGCYGQSFGEGAFTHICMGGSALACCV